MDNLNILEHQQLRDSEYKLKSEADNTTTLVYKSRIRTSWCAYSIIFSGCRVFCEKSISRRDGDFHRDLGKGFCEYTNEKIRREVRIEFLRKMQLVVTEN